MTAGHRGVFILLMVVLPAAAAAADDRLLGLLRLPEVFGNGPCAPFEPRAVPVFADPDGKQSMATIEVDRNWSFAPHGGCEGLEVRVHQGAARAELPTREYDYEAPAAIVVERRGLWFRIRLHRASGWVEAPAAERFLSLESLLEEFVGVTYVADGFARSLADGPGRPAPNRIGGGVRGRQPVRVAETRWLDDRLWLRVEVLNHPVCEAAAHGPPEMIAQGWMPAHTDNGEPTVWFSSRGC